MPSKRRKKISTTLEKFYNNPIAKVSLELFLSVGTILFFALFAIRPTLLTMSDLIKEIDDKKELEKKLEQKVASLATAQTIYLNIEDRLGVVDESIPSQPNLIKTFKIVEKIASDQGISIDRMGLSEIPKEESPIVPFEMQERKVLSFNIVVIGDYPSLREFVETLRNSRRSFIINSVTFAIEDTRGFEKLKASVSVSAPYFSEK